MLSKIKNLVKNQKKKCRNTVRGLLSLDEVSLLFVLSYLSDVCPLDELELLELLLEEPLSLVVAPLKPPD